MSFVGAHVMTWDEDADGRTRAACDCGWVRARFPDPQDGDLPLGMAADRHIREEAEEQARGRV